MLFNRYQYPGWNQTQQVECSTIGESDTKNDSPPQKNSSKLLLQ